MIIWIRNDIMDYEEKFTIIRDNLDEDYIELLNEYLDLNLGEDDGYYEFDGDINNTNEYLIQLNDESDNWEECFQKAVSKVLIFFTNDIVKKL